MSILLRSLLFHAKQAESVADVVDAIEVMCSKDDIAAVNEQINKRKTAAPQ